MPRCAAFVDDLREAFGAAEINAVIKRGLRPEAHRAHRVHFSEAGHVLGHPLHQAPGVTVAQMVVGPQVTAKKRGRE